MIIFKNILNVATTESFNTIFTYPDLTFYKYFSYKHNCSIEATNFFYHLKERHLLYPLANTTTRCYSSYRELYLC